VNITNTLKDLINKLLQKEPKDRLGQNGGVVEILTHPWFKDVDFEGIMGRKIKPPYTPELLKYNFDEEEFNKGDLEFRK
jgi:serum/glucocorticoid-regulated kinase 2